MPLIGITSDSTEINGRETYFVYTAYANAVKQCNGIPVLLVNTKAAGFTVERIDGLVIAGGDFDIPAAMYGEDAVVETKTCPERTRFESEVYTESLKRGIPVLGICGGMQLINVIAGGSLFQDIKKRVPDSLDHLHGNHEIILKSGTLLSGIIKQNRIITNTNHHQSVKKTGKGVIVSAKAEDGIIEAIELKDFPGILGVQWHPERMDAEMLSIYRWLITQALKYRKTRSGLHISHI